MGQETCVIGIMNCCMLEQFIVLSYILDIFAMLSFSNLRWYLNCLRLNYWKNNFANFIILDVQTMH